MPQAITFSARALKKISLTGVDIVVKKNWNVVYRCLYSKSYQQRVCVITLFLNIFSYCFQVCMLSKFAKVFERKVWSVQVAHLHNASRALSSLSRCFQLSKNLEKDSFRFLWYCGKEQIKCRLAGHWWNSADLELIYTFFTNQNAEIPCTLSFRKSRHKPNLEITSKYGFPPDFEGKSGGVLSMRMQVIPDFLFARPGSAPIWDGKLEKRVQGLDYQ